jgi:hypothetical protein
MRREHQVAKDFFKPAKTVPTIQVAATDNREVRHAEALPYFKHNFMSPSQPHSKLCAR